MMHVRHLGAASAVAACRGRAPASRARRAADRHRTLVSSLRKPVLAAAGLAVRAGLDADLRAGRRAACLAAAPDDAARAGARGLFAPNGFLNIMWSVFFFRLQRPDWALMEVRALAVVLADRLLRPFARRPWCWFPISPGSASPPC